MAGLHLLHEGLIDELLLLQAVDVLLQAMEHLVVVESQQGLGNHLLVDERLLLKAVDVLLQAMEHLVVVESQQGLGNPLLVDERLLL